MPLLAQNISIENVKRRGVRSIFGKYYMTFGKCDDEKRPTETYAHLLRKRKKEKKSSMAPLCQARHVSYPDLIMPVEEWDNLEITGNLNSICVVLIWATTFQIITDHKTINYKQILLTSLLKYLPFVFWL